jgi:hypothetical protein
MFVFASPLNPARYRTPTLNKKHRHREERSDVAIHDFRGSWIATLRSQ